MDDANSDDPISHDPIGDDPADEHPDGSPTDTLAARLRHDLDRLADQHARSRRGRKEADRAARALSLLTYGDLWPAGRTPEQQQAGEQALKDSPPPF